MTADPDRHYQIAQRALGLNPRSDEQAAARLAELLADKEVIDPASLQGTFEDETAIVLGPVPGGAESVDPSNPIVAAGSAVRQALSAGIQPTLVVSDLDGSDMAHKMFSRVGATTAVHAHGDNVHVLERLVPELEGPLFGTCQTAPPSQADVPLHRYPGFTDGDRACFVAAALGASRLQLAGWDLEEPVSGGEDKQEKLDLAAALLEDVEIPIEFLEPDEPSAKRLEDLDLGEGIELEFGDEV